MDFDRVLAEVGEFGRWQQGVQLLAWVFAAFGGVHALLFSFTGAVGNCPNFAQFWPSVH